MKRIIPVVILSVAAIAALDFNLDKSRKAVQPETVQDSEIGKSNNNYRVIEGIINRGETLYGLFKRYSLDLRDFVKMKEASASVHRLREVAENRPFKLTVDEQNRVHSFEYNIDDTCLLSIVRGEDEFIAKKCEIAYDRRVSHVAGTIKGNLIASIGEGRENLLLALDFSDILAWDVDFTSDLRDGDTFKVVVEKLYEGNEFRKYGNILAVEFVNNGMVYKAFRFENDGRADYFDENGNSLRKAFLKAPLSFRRISSGFSKGRFHPVLKKYRPHHGLDYAAPTGTPVSAIGDGTVVFAGNKGQYGRLIILRHANGYKTYYGHLSRFGKGIRNGVKVTQGQIIASVGSTGLATGPHLHYEIRVNSQPMNPMAIKTSAARPVPAKAMSQFESVKSDLIARLSAIPLKEVVASQGGSATPTGRLDGV